MKIGLIVAATLLTLGAAAMLMSGANPIQAEITTAANDQPAPAYPAWMLIMEHLHKIEVEQEKQRNDILILQLGQKNTDALLYNKGFLK